MSVLLFPVEAGVRGLRGDVLHHLVQSRYASALAGSPASAILDLDQIHETVSHAVASTPELTLEALEALVSLGLVETAGEGEWRATSAGVVAVDRTHDYAEERAA